MKLFRQKIVGSFTLLAILVSQRSDGVTVYSATDPTGSLVFPAANAEMGNSITLSGIGRIATRLEIGIYSQGGIFPNGTPGSGDLNARLYANDGPSGEPGSLLWQSGVVSVNYPGGVSLLGFDIPQLLVPDNLTWTLQYTPTSALPPAIASANPPTIGSQDGSGWTRPSGDVWNHLTTGNWTLMADLQAIPEPGVLSLLSAGAIACWLLFGSGGGAGARRRCQSILAQQPEIICSAAEGNRPAL